jgi:hypothetical protein
MWVAHAYFKFRQVEWYPGGKMKLFGNLLRYFTIYVVYPVIVAGLFFFLGYSIYNLIKHAREGERLRRIAGAALPVVVLVFALVLSAHNDLGMSGLYSSLNSFWGFIFGLFIGVAVIAVGNYIKEFEIEILPPLFTFFLSLLTVFILYSIMQFKLGALNYFLMGMLIGGAIVIIWKGIPDPERYNPWTVKGHELHLNIAKEYLSREVGLSTSEVDHLIENTGFFPILAAGNYVFNYYINGVYFSAVTRGDASVAPGETLSAHQAKQLNDLKDELSDKSSVLVDQGDASVKPKETFSTDDGKQPNGSEDVSDDESSEFKKLEW